MVTTILEQKLVQELASVDQEPLFLVFLDLNNAYKTVDCGLLLKTLEGYGAGPYMFRFLSVFCDHQEIVTHQERYHKPQFRAT